MFTAKKKERNPLVSVLLAASACLFLAGYAAAALFSNIGLELKKAKYDLERAQLSTTNYVEKKYGFSKNQIEYVSEQRLEIAKGLKEFLNLHDKKEELDHFIDTFGSGAVPVAMNNFANIVNKNFPLHQYTIIPDDLARKCQIVVNSRSWSEPIFKGTSVTPSQDLFLRKIDWKKNVNGIFHPEDLSDKVVGDPDDYIRVRATFHWVIMYGGHGKFLHLVTEDDIYKRMTCAVGVQIKREFEPIRGKENHRAD